MLSTKTFLETLAAKWSAKFPDHIDRINRGLAYALGNKVAPRSCQSWRVAGSKGAEYTVEVNCGFPSCNCPDFTERPGTRCKHIWAAALMTRLAAELEGALQVPTPPKAKRQAISGSLEQHCAKLHEQNHRAADRLPETAVIPIRR